MSTNSLANVRRIAPTAWVHTIATALQPIYGDYAVAYRHAWSIIEHVTGLNRTTCIAQSMLSLTHEQETRAMTILDAVCNHAMPLAYALGTAPFLDLTLKVQPPILIPRPETEEWVARAIEQLTPYVARATADHPFILLDLCTGSGCIALAFAFYLRDKHIRVIGVDISQSALDCAQAQLQTYNLTNCSFIHSDLYQGLPPNFTCDSIVANPPYVSLEEFTLLGPEVRLWEDYGALVGGDQGLTVIERLVTQAPSFLRSDYGCQQLWCEIGAHQAAAVLPLYTAAGFKEVTVTQDIAGNDRVIWGACANI
jgi:release factor glutamine methyltransferase